MRLIGAGSENLLYPQDKNIDQLGFVQDTEAEMASWSLSIVPVFVGGGTRIKIAEAFSPEVPDRFDDSPRRVWLRGGGWP